MATLTEPLPPTLPADVPPAAAGHLLRELRRRCPCPSADPVIVDLYEQALREWVSRTNFERAVAGFEGFVASSLATTY